MESYYSVVSKRKQRKYNLARQAKLEPRDFG
jgi:hypothetical protein